MICSHHRKKNWNTNIFWLGFFEPNIRLIHHHNSFRSNLWDFPSLSPFIVLLASTPLSSPGTLTFSLCKVEKWSGQDVQWIFFFKLFFLIIIHIIIKFFRYIFLQKDKLESHFFKVSSFFLPFLKKKSI